MMLLSSRKGQNKNFEKVGHYRELSEEFFSCINENTGDRKHYVEFMKNNPYIAKRKFINVNAYNVQNIERYVFIHFIQRLLCFINL